MIVTYFNFVYVPKVLFMSNDNFNFYLVLNIHCKGMLSINSGKIQETTEFYEQFNGQIRMQFTEGNFGVLCVVF